MGMSPGRSWTLREWASRLLGGAAFGCLALFLLCLLVLELLLGPRMKGQRLWQLRIPEYVLPAMIILGGFVGVAWQCTREIRLSRGWLLGICLAIVMMVQALRISLSRIPSKGFGPLCEEVPDTLAMIFCLVGLLIVVFDRGKRSSPVSEAGSPSRPESQLLPEGST